MGETEELIRADGLDQALTDKPASLPKVNNNTVTPPDGEVISITQPPCFVVAIGASAGGHEPLEHIFTAMPVDCNLSFVVVMHIPTEGPSLLVDLIRHYTSMEVLSAEDGMPLMPNTVHVIPPGVILTFKEGKLRHDPSEVTGRPHHPIDRFFTSLAVDCGACAIAIVLSGFGLDGSEGVKRIKEGGGFVLVQEPASAINPSMPQNAIATGAADMVLSAEEIPGRIAEIARGKCHLPQRACHSTTIDEELHEIFALVKARTGHDFSSYKKNTILRRIERRMTVNEAGGIRKYLAILENNPLEAQALCQEILIGVTSFFRDPEAFELLRCEIIPRLFAGRDSEEPVRIWHACCATGEEVYSVAMLIQEYLEKESLQAKVQIFATDIDEGAVAQARAGLYSDDIGPDVGEERLNRFFTRCGGRWQVSKRLREMIVFAHHSIIKDPPFSRLDLLVCRNFLIYLDMDMQRRLVTLFHMVLKPGGILFLGASESVGRNTELFTMIDNKWKIFRRLESSRREETFFPFTSPARKLARNTPPKRPAEAQEPAPGAMADKLLVERYSPLGVVVNEKYEVLHISTRTQRYLELSAGEPVLDILRMAREELRPALRAAIYKSFTEQKQVTFRGVKMAIDAGEAAVNILVEPLAADSAYGRLAMVILEQAPSPAKPLLFMAGETLPGDESSKDMLIRQLEEQLQITHEQLQVTSEQLETSNDSFLSTNEELMSINEEFQSTNEELQSTNEELETSKEELQALNEELVTVNAELQGKVEELNQSNSDMENLFASSEIAAIFLDRGLIIKRYSPAMAAIFNLIPADIGRPFRHLAGTIDWSGLPRDAQEVLEKIVPVEREVTALENGHSFIMRILPYRTTDSRIDGIVVTLIDITERKRMEEDNARLAALVEYSDDAIIAKNMNGTIFNWNTGAERLFGYRADEVIGKPINFLIPPELQDEEEQILLRLSAGERIEHFETVRLSKNGRRIEVSVTVSPIMDSQGRIIGASKIARDITERKRTEAALRDSEACLQAANDALLVANDNLQLANEQLEKQSEELQAQNRELARLWKESRRTEEVLGESRERLSLALISGRMATFDWDIVNNKRTWDDYVHILLGTNPETFTGTSEEFFRVMPPEDRDIVQKSLSKAIETTGEYETEYRAIWPDGTIHHIAARGRVHRDGAGQADRMTGLCWDITERKLAEEALREKTEELAAVLDSVPAPVIIVHDPDSLHMTGNIAADEMLRHQRGTEISLSAPEEVRPRHFKAFKDGRELTLDEMPAQRAARGNHVKDFEFNIVFDDGTALNALGYGTPLLDNEGQPRGAVHVLIDITERKRAEEELRKAKVVAEAANRAKSQFLANMSHELRTPMTGVLGMHEFALNTPLNAQQRDFIETAHKSAQTLLRILNDILDLSKVESGKLLIEESPFVLEDCVVGAIDILIPEARRKGLELNCAIADDLHKIVVGDQVRLLQVLTNLLGNAVKYTERGEVKITVTAGLQTSAGKREINFVVTDTGIGIPADKKEIIFQSFTQADESHSRRYGGVGLGLAISRELVERMGGTITCDSKEGVGSTFSFTIPFGDDRSGNERANMPVTPPPLTVIPVSSDVKQRGRLLLAEDDPITRQVIGIMLRNSNFDLDIAENGLRAVELWEKGNYDLVLMDVQMPGLDGFAATGVIREKERANGGHTLIVAMTAHAFPEDEKRCLAAGMDGYISKPIDLKECIAKLEKLIGERNLEA